MRLNGVPAREKARRFLLFALVAALLPWRLEGEEPVPAALVEGGRPLVALTFDDGPRRSTTNQLLDGLAQRGVPATFFLVGELAEQCPDLVKRMAEEGHQVGIHTWDHVRLTGLNAADFQAQVGRTETLLTQLLGQKGFALRPPYGLVDNGVKKRAGGAIVLWSVDPRDWEDKNTERIVAQVVSEVQDGDIILLHDIYPTSVAAALQIVDALHAKGFYFVTVEELAAQRSVTLEPGKSYCHFHP